MKKLLFGLLLFNFTNLWADTITSGSIGLLKPTTGVVSARPAGDKLNSNFDMIAATITTLFQNISGVVSSTGPITNSFNAFTSTVQTDIDKLKVFTSTTQVDIDKYKTFSSTVQTDIDKYKTFSSTVQTDIDKYKTFSSTVQTQFDFVKTALATHSVYDVALATTITANDSKVNIATAALFSKVLNGAITVYDEGSRIGEATTINLVGANVTGTQSGSTTTVTVTGSEGGGTSSKAYDLIIGTYGTVGVDMFVDTLEQWNLALGSVNARGLTFSTTAQARILSVNQNCEMKGATIPAGITVYGGSSSTWVHNDNLGPPQFLRLYGKIYNMILNFNEVVFHSPAIQMSSGSKMIDCTIRGTNNQASGVLNSHAIFVNRANDVEISNVRWLDPKPIGGVAMYGDAAPLRVLNSSNVIVDFALYQSGDAGGATSTNMQVSQSTSVSVSGNFINVEGNFINFAEGNADCGVNGRPNGRDTIIEYINNMPADVGAIIIGEASGTSLGISTAAWVKDVQIYYRGTNGASSAIKAGLNSGTGRAVVGLWIKNVSIYCGPTVSSVVGITLNSASINTVIDNVDVYGCAVALTDSGINTNKDGLRKNAINQ